MTEPESAHPADPSLGKLFQQAVTLQQQGLLDAAAECVQAVLHRAPRHAGVLRFYGALEVLRGRFEDGVRLLTSALESDPDSAEAHNNLGMALMALTRPDEAITHYQAAIALNPRYDSALNNLGNALLALDRDQEAAEKFQAALAIRPDFALARTNLGSALTRLGKYEEAIREHRRSLALQNDNAAVHLNLASTLQATGRADEAISHLAKAKEFEPHLAMTHVRLGKALQELGKIDEAQICFSKAVELEPRRAAHYLNLVGNVQVLDNDPRIVMMEQLARNEDALGKQDRPTIHFALGKALADIGQHERAFQHLLRANALKRELVEYDEEKTVGRLSRIPDVFTRQLMHRLRGKGSPSRQPIFILGMPRSGSTLIEQILANHPEVFAAGEVTAFRDAMKHVGLEDGPEPYPDCVARLTSGDLRRLAGHYLATMRGLAAGGQRDGPPDVPRRITDKLPSNFRYVGLIHMAFPNARIIHTCRDPIDTCLSCYGIEFARLPFTFDLEELGRYARSCSDVMAYWHRVLPPDVILDVHYEALVEHFEPETKRIIAHCGLAWDDACLRFHEAQRPVRTASVVQVRQPVYHSSVRKWRPDGTTLAPLLRGLGLLS